MKTDLFMEAARIIRKGGIVAYPTEAVWGLGCDPWNEAAVRRILELKQRPVEKGVIIVTGEISQISPLLSALSKEEIEKITEQGEEKRATTWLIPDRSGWIPGFVKGTHDSVAVRISQHPVIKSLCDATGYPVVSTSANLAGQKEITEYSELVSLFGEKVDMILPGNTGNALKASRIIDLVSGRVIRS